MSDYLFYEPSFVYETETIFEPVSLYTEKSCPPALDQVDSPADFKRWNSDYVLNAYNDDMLSFDSAQQSSAAALPPGYSPVGEGGYYMRSPDGKIVLTPDWQKQVDNRDLNWAGILADFGIIVGAGISILGTWGAAVGGVIAAGAEAVEQSVEQQRIQEEEAARRRLQTIES